ncbi:MAG: hypothetical protein ABIA97_04225 [Candidatus Omnitrophota bacterium]
MDYSKIKYEVLGQSTLEITLAIMIGIVLLMGAISAWNYFSKVKVERMDRYRATRLAALDLRPWGDTGKQVDYEPPPFDIFSMDGAVGGAPGMEGLDDFRNGTCGPEYNELMNTSFNLLYDVGILTNELAGYPASTLPLRADFGMLRIWFRILGNWVETNSYLMMSMYPANQSIFFLKDWDALGSDFDAFVGGSPWNMRFEQEPDIFYSQAQVWNSFIALGIAVEEQAEKLNLELMIKNGLIPFMSKIAEAKFKACMRALEEEDTTCDELCANDLDQVDIAINQTIDQANTGQLNQSMISFQEVMSSTDSYETCFLNCAGEYPWYQDPCFTECEDEFDAYMEKNWEAQNAAAGGRLGDSMALAEEARELYEDYEDCLDGCE